jgi:hypothetical protein
MELQLPRKSSKFDPDSAEVELEGVVDGEDDDRKGSGSLGKRRFLSMETIIRISKLQLLRFIIRETRWSINCREFLPRVIKAVDTWCCARVADVIRNGEAIFDEIKEEISTEISGNSESEEEVEVAPPSKLSSIFTETETQGIHEGLVYEKRLRGAITRPPSIWPSAKMIRDMVGCQTGAPVIGRTEVMESWEGQEITVTAFAGMIVYESTIEDTYLNHLKDIRVTLKVVNFNCPRLTEKADFMEDQRVIKIKGEAEMVRGEHRASGEFTSGEFWSMESLVILGHQKDLKIDVHFEDVVFKWRVDAEYLRRIKERILIWCAGRIGHAVIKKPGGFVRGPTEDLNITPIFKNFFDDGGATFCEWRKSGSTNMWTAAQHQKYNSLDSRCTFDNAHLERHWYNIGVPYEPDRLKKVNHSFRGNPLSFELPIEDKVWVFLPELEWLGDAFQTCITHLNAIKVKIELSMSKPVPKWRGLTLEMRGGDQRRMRHLTNEYWSFSDIITLMSLYRPVIYSNTAHFVGLRDIGRPVINEIYGIITKACVWSIGTHLREAGLTGTRQLANDKAYRLSRITSLGQSTVHVVAHWQPKEPLSSPCHHTRAESPVRPGETSIVPISTPGKSSENSQTGITQLTAGVGGLDINDGVITLDVVMSSEEERSEVDRFSEVNSVITEAYSVNQHRSKIVPGIKKLGNGSQHHIQGRGQHHEEAENGNSTHAPWGA